MQSEKSCSKWTVFTKTVGRFWPIWATYLVIWVMMLPLRGLMEIQRTDTMNGMTAFERYANQSVLGFGGNAMWLSIIFGVMAAMAVFSHLYSSRSASFYGALPVRREWIFSIQYVAGLSFLIVPNLIVFGLTLLVELVGGSVELEPLLYWLGTTCGDSFFFYSMAVLVAMLVGHILAVPAFFLIGNWLAVGVYSILQTVLGELYYGFAQTHWNLNRVVQWLSPMGQLVKVGMNTEVIQQPDGSFQWTFHSNGMHYVAIYAGVAVLMTVASLLLYRVRRLESAGDLVAVKSLRPVFKYGVALCGGLGLGSLTAQILSGGKVVLILAILFWGVTSCFVAQMMLDKSFKVFQKWKGPAAVAGVFLVLLIVVNFDLTGFETRVPDPAEVRLVEVDGLYSPGAGYGVSYQLNLEITDQDQIANVLILHQWALEHREIRQPEEAADLFQIPLNLTYQLRGGGTISRSYTVEIDPADMNQEGSAAWALEQLYADRDLYWKAYGFDEVHSILENNGRLDASYYAGAFSKDFNQQEGAALLEAVEQDFWAGAIGRPSLAYLLNEEMWVDRGLRFHANSSADERGAGVVYVSMDFVVPDTAANTLRLLTQQGVDTEKTYENIDAPPVPDTSSNPDASNGGESSASPNPLPDNFDPVITSNRIEIWIDNPNAFEEDE